MKIFNKIVGVIAAVAIVSFYVYQCNMNAYYIPAQLKQHGILLNGWIYDWHIGSKGGKSLAYEFYYKGQRITGYTGLSRNIGYGKFVHAWFPVMYDTAHGHHTMLIEPEDFKEFNITYPDSLSWVLPYFKD